MFKQKNLSFNFLLTNLLCNSLNDLIIFKNDKYVGAGEYFFETINYYGGKTVQEETNFNCTDNHLGESGHRVQSELFFNYIMKYENDTYIRRQL